MKAVVRHVYGQRRDVLEFTDVEAPTIGADLVLVEVRAGKVVILVS